MYFCSESDSSENVMQPLLVRSVFDDPMVVSILVPEIWDETLFSRLQIKQSRKSCGGAFDTKVCGSSITQWLSLFGHLSFKTWTTGTYLYLTSSDWISCSGYERGSRATFIERLTNACVVLAFSSVSSFADISSSLSRLCSVCKDFLCNTLLF